MKPTLIFKTVIEIINFSKIKNYSLIICVLKFKHNI